MCFSGLQWKKVPLNGRLVRFPAFQVVYAAVEIAFERDVDSQFRERTSGDEGGEIWLRIFRMIKIAFDFSAEAFHLIKSVGGESLEMNVRELFAVLESAGKDKEQRFGAVGKAETYKSSP